jgi:hypothetical protein
MRGHPWHDDTFLVFFTFRPQWSAFKKILKEIDNLHRMNNCQYNLILKFMTNITYKLFRGWRRERGGKYPGLNI